MQSGNHAHQRTLRQSVLRRSGKSRLRGRGFSAWRTIPLRKFGKWMLRLKWIFFISASLSVLSLHLWQSLNLPYYQLFGEAYRRIESSDKIVALTFDDGPDLLYTSRILEVLDRNQIKATFFMVGQSIVEHPKVAHAVYRQGHELGNHSYSHEWMVFKSLSFVRSEIDRTDLLLRGLGVTDDSHFRSPYGAQLFSVPLILWQLGKKNILFDVNPRDWEMQDPSVLAQRILDNAKAGSIISLHDGGGDRSGTVRAVELIIPELRRRDFRFVTVSELLAHAAKMTIESD